MLCPGFGNSLFPANRIRRLCFFLSGLRPAFLNKILPLLDSDFRLLRASFHGTDKFINTIFNRLPSAVNGMVTVQGFSLVYIFTFHSFADFPCECIPAQFQSAFFWQNIICLSGLDFGFPFYSGNRAFFSYYPNKNTSKIQKEMRPKLGRISSLSL